MRYSAVAVGGIGVKYGSGVSTDEGGGEGRGEQGHAVDPATQNSSGVLRIQTWPSFDNEKVEIAHRFLIAESPQALSENFPSRSGIPSLHRYRYQQQSLTRVRRQTGRGGPIKFFFGEQRRVTSHYCYVPSA